MEITLKKKKTKAETRFALPLESDGKINLIISKRSGCGASSQGHPEGLQALSQVKLCFHPHAPW